MSKLRSRIRAPDQKAAETHGGKSLHSGRVAAQSGWYGPGAPL